MNCIVDSSGRHFKALKYAVPMRGDWYLMDTMEVVQATGSSGVEAIRLIVEPLK